MHSGAVRSRASDCLFFSAKKKINKKKTKQLNPIRFQLIERWLHFAFPDFLSQWPQRRSACRPKSSRRSSSFSLSLSLSLSLTVFLSFFRSVVVAGPVPITLHSHNRFTQGLFRFPFFFFIFFCFVGRHFHGWIIGCCRIFILPHSPNRADHSSLCRSTSFFHHFFVGVGRCYDNVRFRLWFSLIEIWKGLLRVALFCCPE